MDHRPDVDGTSTEVHAHQGARLVQLEQQRLHVVLADRELFRPEVRFQTERELKPVREQYLRLTPAWADQTAGRVPRRPSARAGAIDERRQFDRDFTGN